MRHYYIIGTKWQQEDGSYNSMFREMLRAKCVAVGYAWRYDLTKLYGKLEVDIASALHRKGEPSPSRRTHSLFLNLRPGDIVAVKNFAAPKGATPRLAIHRYAVVRARAGRIYRYSRGDLSHQVSVDFLNCGRDLEFQIGGYGATIHRLSNPEHIRLIFAPVLRGLSQADTFELSRADVPESRRAARLKNIQDQVRRMKRTVLATAQHNKLQNRLYNHLVRAHGAQAVLMEHDHTDLQLRTRNITTLYEVKAYPDAITCLREALGQILLYAWRLSSDPGPPLKLMIVGPSKLTNDAADFLRYLQKRFGTGLDYMAFTYENSRR
jgi:hypothetical protein